jgi:co-chaperonin GroES (HSP10)
MSKLLEAFQFACGFELIGDLMMVEIIPDEELVTKSGIILNSEFSRNQMDGTFSDKPLFCRVLKVGPGFYDDSFEDKPIPCNSKVGDIVLVGGVSVKRFTIFGQLQTKEKIGLVKDQDVQGRFGNFETFNQYFKELNGFLKDA